ncbi:MAG: hypothetical protein Ct9H300mP1_00330 [Planctomycetaceae bacterium]|nr:MAG: hypothetical protein Ct9H300mP1_00330 [Planctomycetaceae bacterium]
MAYGDSTLSKFEYARQLAAALAYLLLAQRDAVGLTIFDDHVRTRLSPSTQQALFAQVTDTLDQLQPTDESSSDFSSGVAESLGEVLPTLSRRSLVVVISDFLDDTDKLIAALARFRHARHELILFHVVAPERGSTFRSLGRHSSTTSSKPHAACWSIRTASGGTLPPQLRPVLQPARTGRRRPGRRLPAGPHQPALCPCPGPLPRFPFPGRRRGR